MLRAVRSDKTFDNAEHGTYDGSSW